MAKSNPNYVGVVLGSHGLFTWGPTAKESYETTLRIINKAAVWLDKTVKRPVFKGAAVEQLSADERMTAAARLLPAIRGRISKGEMKAGHFDDLPEVLEFVNSRQAWRACPTWYLVPGSLHPHQDQAPDRAP